MFSQDLIAQLAAELDQAEKSRVQLEHFSKRFPGMTVDEAEQKLIMATLDSAGGNKTRAAEMLGISLKTLHNKLNRFKEDDARGTAS